MTATERAAKIEEAQLALDEIHAEAHNRNDGWTMRRIRVIGAALDSVEPPRTKCRTCGGYGWISGSVGGDPDVLPEPCPACDEAVSVAVVPEPSTLSDRDAGWNEGVEAVRADFNTGPDEEWTERYIHYRCDALLIPTVPPSKET